MKLKNKYRLEHYADEILKQYLEDNDNVCRMKFIDYITNSEDDEAIKYLIEYIYDNHPKLYKVLYTVILEYQMHGFENLIDSKEDEDDDFDGTCEEFDPVEEYNNKLNEQIAKLNIVQVIYRSIQCWWEAKRKVS